RHFVKVPPKHETAALRWLAHGEGTLTPAQVERLVTIKAELEAESELAIVFGSEISGAAISQLVAFASKLPYKARFMALADYANSRGAADMGVLPDRFPGYAYVDDAKSREALEKLWSGGPLPSKPGMTTPQMVQAAQDGKLKALYVMGANPFDHYG